MVKALGSRFSHVGHGGTFLPHHKTYRICIAYKPIVALQFSKPVNTSKKPVTEEDFGKPRRG